MLIDSHGRTIDYIRISVTQNCNFRCRYCMPATPIDKIIYEDLLSTDELFLFIKTLIDEGVKKIRITGGEPTLRSDLANLLKLIFDYKPNIEIALTTNGYLMKKYAKSFANAGLGRINISLDSLNAHTASKIAGGKDILKDVLEGIDACLNENIRVKLNTVGLKGYNDKEIVDILEYGIQKGIMVRYIEQMANTHASDVIGMKADEILKIIEKKYPFKEENTSFRSPAKLYRLENGYLFGVIEPHRDDFCESCNRMRISADGKIIPCLYYDDAVSVKEALQNKDANKALEIFRQALQNKPLKNEWGNNKTSNRAFYYTGG